MIKYIKQILDDWQIVFPCLQGKELVPEVCDGGIKIMIKPTTLQADSLALKYIKFVDELKKNGGLSSDEAITMLKLISEMQFKGKKFCGDTPLWCPPIWNEMKELYD